MPLNQLLYKPLKLDSSPAHMPNKITRMNQYPKNLIPICIIQVFIWGGKKGGADLDTSRHNRRSTGEQSLTWPSGVSAGHIIPHCELCNCLGLASFPGKQTYKI